MLDERTKDCRRRAAAYARLSKKNPIKFLRNLSGGKPIAIGLFKLADTYGFSLIDSIFECEKNGAVACLSAYVADAVLAGWQPKRAIDDVRIAYKFLCKPVSPVLLRGLALAAKHADRFSSEGMLSRAG